MPIPKPDLTGLDALIKRAAQHIQEAHHGASRTVLQFALPRLPHLHRLPQGAVAPARHPPPWHRREVPLSALCQQRVGAAVLMLTGDTPLTHACRERQSPGSYAATMRTFCAAMSSRAIGKTGRPRRRSANSCATTGGSRKGWSIGTFIAGVLILPMVGVGSRRCLQAILEGPQQTSTGAAMSESTPTPEPTPTPESGHADAGANGNDTDTYGHTCAHGDPSAGGHGTIRGNGRISSMGRRGHRDGNRHAVRSVLSCPPLGGVAVAAAKVKGTGPREWRRVAI